MKKKSYFRVMTIAGSDPSGGAGVQADIKTISACGCYATSAIVALVDENTVGVYDVLPVPEKFVATQIHSILDDVGTDAVKIGMLHSAELIRTVRNTLDAYPEIKNIVVDPVMVATSGDPLLEEDAVATLMDVLIPKSRIITPNIPEAEILLGHKIGSQDELPDAAVELSRFGASVMLKAGHLYDEKLLDVFYNAETKETIYLESKRIDTVNTHGTGCTLSSAIASYLARGFSLNDSVKLAKDYIMKAIKSGARYKIGNGHGPVNHFQYSDRQIAIIDQI
ncbi:MAG: bifunctional hydroxymethylpyrimidine kinase/phosphomethylpyrimidine kinase [Muribaculaceae bacterium]|nr:bifunctional hydroxymethylpyrimidine kinase/phosphomethylpyrimidine kinase [Muribaculaceae bacterium]